MKKIYEKGFFLSETMVVMAIVAIILVTVFKLFSTTYIKFQESEKYNTVNSINALSNVKKYLESFGEIDAEELLEGNAFVEITDSSQYASNFYQSIKAEYNINNIYLIDMSLIKSNLSTFNMQYKNYINSLPDSSDKILLINVKGNEFTSVNISNNLPRLIGDANNEYAVYIEPGEGFVDPGYTNWNGEQPTTTWEPTLDINTEGIYYLKYTFGNYILRRKVQVLEKEKEFNYTESEQIFIAPATGTYQMEVWGASGNTPTATNVNHGYGGYSVGNIHLNKNYKLYIYIGGQGNDGIGYSGSFTIAQGGYNGGGSGKDYVDGRGAGGGGGATHIATTSGLLSTLSENTSSILIVAGGGGGTGNYKGLFPTTIMSPGSGGGFIGTNGSGGGFIGYGGTQTAGGDRTGTLTQYKGTAGIFGVGGNCSTASEGNCSGAGGGYYGGGSNYSYSGAAGGGSGYINNADLANKSMYCYGCTESTETGTYTINTIGTSNLRDTVNCSVGYSESPISKCAKSGNGYAKITFIG